MNSLNAEAVCKTGGNPLVKIYSTPYFIRVRNGIIHSTVFTAINERERNTCIKEKKTSSGQNHETGDQNPDICNTTRK